MSTKRRTKQQIQDDKAKLLKNKKKALDKLNTHLDDVNNISEEEKNKVRDFIFLFFQCETVYKTLYSDMMKLKDDEQVDVRKLSFNLQKFEAALRYFGIKHDHEKMKIMFFSKNSFLTCRDKIVHGLIMDSINEVVDNYDDMISTMKEFLTSVVNGKPE